jgi:sugar-specific transcriptional regulator trmB
LGLGAGEIAVLAFLMYCEDRKTYQCHPSYSTIGSACGMSNNTVKKYVGSLVRKGFLCTKPTMVKTRDGRSHNGSLCYTIRPIQPLEENYNEEQLRIAENHALLSKAMKKYGGINFEKVNL